MPSDPLPLSPTGKALLKAAEDRLVIATAEQPIDLTETVLAIEQEARTLARTVDVDALAEALHDAMCDVSHHDRPPARCSRWPKYPNIAASVAPRYLAALSRLGERE